ncbi:Non-specific serine/threonine protein kinase [Bertholletia excelsa]
METLVSNPLYLLFVLVIPICCNSYEYDPPDNIALDCGTFGRSESDGRIWQGDIASTLSPSDDLKSSVRNSTHKPSNMIPYYTARLSRSNFSYQFQLSSSGPIFIRLHFFPTPYQDFDPYKAFFSVKVNQFTLLNNFSAYAFAAFLQKETVIREFSINVGEDKGVNMTFTTSHTPPDAYAFVNGIEIISMPMDLYYGSDDANGLIVIGTANAHYLENDTALEMVHRLNVGGEDVSPTGDTGVFRQWLKDNDYVSIVGAAPANLSIKPRFGIIIPNYSAPDTVYQTARSMGINGTQNQGYNLTWNLPIDPGFSYMVRLHFCEIESIINKTSDRVFQIYLANQTAEADFDVIARTGNIGNGIPIYRDYMVTINGGTANKQNLSLALHPVPASRTRHSDAILNGIEVFKMSDSNHNLAGPNPDLHPPPSPTQPSSSKRKNTKQIIAICCGIISGVVALSVLGFFVFQRRTRALFGAIKPNKAKHHGCRPMYVADSLSPRSDRPQITSTML